MLPLKMKTGLLVLLFVGLVVQNKGLREEDDVEDKDLELEGEKRSFAFPYSYAQPLINKVNTALDSFHGDAAKRARRLLQMVNKDWNKQVRKERKLRQVALERVEDNIQAIADAKQNTNAAFISVLDLIEWIKQWTPSNGCIVTIPAMFTTSIINLFGETVDPFSLESIIAKEINDVKGKYNEILNFQNQAKRSKFSYSAIKNILNNLGKDDDKIRSGSALDDVIRIDSYISAFASGFPGILEKNIKRLIGDNRPEDAKKFLTYLELYAKLDTVMQMMLIHALSLIPGDNPPLSDIFLSAIEKRKNDSQDSLVVIYDPSRKSRFMAYYDWPDYRVIEVYSYTMHKFSSGGDDPELRCITLVGDTVPWKWSLSPGKNHPYFHKADKQTPCKWRIATHGRRIYSIINKYDCPDGPWCDALLSYDSGDSRTPTFITVEHNDPLLWKLTTKSWRVPRDGLTFKPIQFCDSPNLPYKCNCSMGYDYQTFDGILDCSEQQSRLSQQWRVVKKKYLGKPDQDSAATNHSSEDQEDNSTSGEEDNGVNNFSDENENGIVEKSKQETDEAESNQDSDTENDIED